MQHHKGVCDPLPHETPIKESSRRKFSPVCHTNIPRHGQRDQISPVSGHDCRIESHDGLHFKNVSGQETGRVIATNIQPEKVEQVSRAPKIQVDKPRESSGFSSKRRLSGFDRLVTGLLSHTDCGQTQEVSNIHLQRDSLPLDLSAIRVINRTPSVRHLDKLGSISVAREGDSNNCLFGRFSVGQPRSRLPSGSSKLYSASSQFPRLECEREEITTLACAVHSVSRDNLEHGIGTHFSPCEKDSSHSRSSRENARSVEMVSEISSSLAGNPQFCSLCCPSRTPPHASHSVGKPTALSSIATLSDVCSSGGDGDVTLVEIEHTEGLSITPSRESCVPVLRRFRHRMGSTGSGTVLSGYMDGCSEELAYQPEGIVRSTVCNLGELPPSGEPYDHSTIGQQDSRFPHSEAGGSKISSSLEGNSESVFSYARPEHSYSSLLHSGQIQHNRGRVISTDQPTRVAPETVDHIDSVQEMGIPTNRFVCFSQREGGSEIRISGSKRPSVGISGRVLEDLEFSTSVGVSSPSVNASGLTSPEQSERVVHSSSPALGESFLESRSEVQSASPPINILGLEYSLGGCDDGPSTSADRRSDVGDLVNTGWSAQISEWSTREKELLSAAWRPSTISSYRKPWTRWINWARSIGIDAFSPSPQHLAKFLAHLYYDENLAPASIMLHKSVVTTMSNPDRSTDLASHPIVSKMIKAITSKASATSQECRTIWNVSDLLDWMSTNPPRTSSFFEVSRHLSLLLLLSSGRRIHDLTLLHMDSSRLQYSEDSITFWPAFGSKTDSASFRQSGWQYSTCSSSDIWNVAHWLKIFLSLRAERCGSIKISNLFISSFGQVRPASRAIIAGWVKTALKAVGIPFSPGSLRSAVNSSLARKNFSLDVIMARANWRSADTFLRHYYKPLDFQQDSRRITSLSFKPIF